MNWRLSQLDRFSLVSFSDLHSYWPWRIGREATVFNIKLSYDNLIKALKTKEGLKETIEVDPNYGKYHLTGHRNCNVCLKPKDAVKLKDICPKCGKKLTVGVLQRIEELADRPEGYMPKNPIPFKSLIPLSEILASLMDSGVASKKIWAEYNNLIKHFGSEYKIMLYATLEELNKVTDPKIAEVIIKNRNGEIEIQGGFDGEYGIPIFSEKDKKQFVTEIKKKQKGLEEFY
jgi:uncharacterized protein (TIGR00375 family)